MTDHYPEHVFLEKHRIGKLAQIREIIFGAQDGLLVPLGVISSVAGAFASNEIVIVAGISEALAGAFSMASGGYLSSQAEHQVYQTEIKKERAAIKAHPQEEIEEMAMLFEEEGMPKERASIMAKEMAEYPELFANTMIQKELGIDPEPAGGPIRDSVVIGFSYLCASLIPLVPYFFIEARSAIPYSIVLTLLALFSLGVIKGRFASLSYVKSGLQILLVGTVSGIGGYLLGVTLPYILGIQ
ncbi:MAG: VIT1/CCC1 transporter family protein [Patescibacteria group bacterium]